MQNRLKPETPPTLSILREAAIRTLMITGDNLLTGVAVARMSGMVAEDHHVVLVQAECKNPDRVGRSPSLSYHVLGGGDMEQSLMSSLGKPGECVLDVCVCACHGGEACMFQ